MEAKPKATRKGKARACRVPGCTEALPEDRAYYRRYRVCFLHSQLKCMELGGKQVRFCMLCGKFQELEAFEGDRKSCRKMLEVHNARRRKNSQEQTAALLKQRSAAPPGTTGSPASSDGAGGWGSGGAAGSWPQSNSASRQAAGRAPVVEGQAAEGATNSVQGGGGNSCGQAAASEEALRGPPHHDSSPLRQQSAGAAGSSIGAAAAVAAAAGARGVGASPPGSVPLGGVAGTGGMELHGMVMDQLMNDVELQEMLAWLPNLLPTSGKRHQPTRPPPPHELKLETVSPLMLSPPQQQQAQQAQAQQPQQQLPPCSNGFLSPPQQQHSNGLLSPLQQLPPSSNGFLSPPQQQHSNGLLSPPQRQSNGLLSPPQQLPLVQGGQQSSWGLSAELAALIPLTSSGNAALLACDLLDGGGGQPMDLLAPKHLPGQSQLLPTQPPQGVMPQQQGGMPLAGQHTFQLPPVQQPLQPQPQQQLALQAVGSPPGWPGPSATQQQQQAMAQLQGMAQQQGMVGGGPLQTAQVPPGASMPAPAASMGMFGGGTDMGITVPAAPAAPVHSGSMQPQHMQLYVPPGSGQNQQLQGQWQGPSMVQQQQQLPPQQYQQPQYQQQQLQYQQPEYQQQQQYQGQQYQQPQQQWQPQCSASGHLGAGASVLPQQLLQHTRAGATAAAAPGPAPAAVPAPHAVLAAAIEPHYQRTHIPSPQEFQEHMVRLSLKMFNITPDELPDSMRQALLGVVSADPLFVDTCVRPGCTHLTIDLCLGSSERERLLRKGAGGLAQQLLQRSGWAAGGMGEHWAADMLVQLHHSVAVVRSGRLAEVLDVRPVAPELLTARPRILLAEDPGTFQPAPPDAGEGSLHSRRRRRQRSRRSESSLARAAAKAAAAELGEERMSEGGPWAELGERVVTLWGRGIASSQCAVVCRQGDRALPVEVLGRGRLPASSDLGAASPGASPPEWVVVRPLGTRVGLLQFEIERSGALSQAVPLVALPSTATVAEAQKALRVLADLRCQPNFVRNLGLVLTDLNACISEDLESDSPAVPLPRPSAGQGRARAAVLTLGLFVAALSNRLPELTWLLSGALKECSSSSAAGGEAGAGAAEGRSSPPSQQQEQQREGGEESGGGGGAAASPPVAAARRGGGEQLLLSDMSVAEVPAAGAGEGAGRGQQPYEMLGGEQGSQGAAAPATMEAASPSRGSSSSAALPAHLSAAAAAGKRGDLPSLPSESSEDLPSGGPHNITPTRSTADVGARTWGRDLSLSGQMLSGQLSALALPSSPAQVPNSCAVGRGAVGSAAGAGAAGAGAGGEAGARGRGGEEQEAGMPDTRLLEVRLQGMQLLQEGSTGQDSRPGRQEQGQGQVSDQAQDVQMDEGQHGQHGME